MLKYTSKPLFSIALFSELLQTKMSFFTLMSGSIELHQFQRQNHMTTNHFPLGLVVRPTQAKWNHSIEH